MNIRHLLFHAVYMFFIRFVITINIPGLEIEASEACRRNGAEA